MYTATSAILTTTPAESCSLFRCTKRPDDIIIEFMMVDLYPLISFHKKAKKVKLKPQ